jgi:hypothetical protein
MRASDVSAGDEATAVQHNNLRSDAQRILTKEDSIRTLSTGDVSIDPDIGLVTIAAESGTEDDMDSMNAATDSFDAGDIVVVIADTGDTITIKDGTAGGGQVGFSNPYDEDVILTQNSKIAYRYNSASTVWDYFFGDQQDLVSIQVKFSGGGGVVFDTDYHDIRWRTFWIYRHNVLKGRSIQTLHRW